MTRFLTRTRLAPAVAVMAVGVMALTACGSDAETAGTSAASPAVGSIEASSDATTQESSLADPSGQTASDGTTAGGAAADGAAAGGTTADRSAAAGVAFPVTIKNFFGDAVIEKAPKRVLTVSWQNQDVAIALGVQPIAISKQTYGGDAEGLLPWVKEALGDSPMPELLDETNGLDFEAIVAAKPDVILAAYSGITDTDYATLSAIAPTLAYPTAPYATDWKETTTLIGEALGKSTEAAALIVDTESYVSDKGAEFPQLAGKTFAYMAFPTDTEINVYTPTDARVGLLAGLGLKVAPSVSEFATGSTNYFEPISKEELDTITSDILILLAGNEAEASSLLADPYIAAMPQVASGAVAVITGESLVMAASAPSVISIPWSMDEYVPLLAAAADKVA